MARVVAALLRFPTGIMFQSTRPRGARLPFLTYLYKHIDVSIHAPAWGATYRLKLILNYRGCFNPRARVGRDVFIPNHF